MVGTVSNTKPLKKLYYVAPSLLRSKIIQLNSTKGQSVNLHYNNIRYNH